MSRWSHNLGLYESSCFGGKSSTLRYTSDEFLDRLSFLDQVDNPLAIPEPLLPYSTDDFFRSLSSSNLDLESVEKSPIMHPLKEPLLSLDEQVSLYKKQAEEEYKASHPDEDMSDPNNDDWEGRPTSESPFVPPPPPLTEPAAADLEPVREREEGDIQRSRENNEIKTNIRTFLQQRTVQTLMFLCDKCRDPHTTAWLESFGGHKNLLKYHGTSAMKVSWDGYFRQLLEREKEVVVVSVKKRGGGVGGWSKNNPFFEQEYADFDVEIDPVSLASRLLSIRDQLSKEWEHDLGIISTQKKDIFNSYRENVRETGGERGQAGWLYKRTTSKLLENDDIYNQGQSSLRFGNFDLLVLLSTQEAVHRVLRANMKEGGEGKGGYEFLRQFYSDRLHYFDGDQPYQRADVFLEELLLTMPSVSKTSSGKVSMNDPMRIAEIIVEMRGEVCKEWAEVMGQISTVEHACIRGEILDKRFGVEEKGE
ncbi:hypothetical protein TrCOL_g2524 [Triparma columacea]|uniref:Uncharacterized protein n=1 Tax=Triparma columacea TaxID=722753 RepID=A0A9W7G802_9STRA|nr:hypothetical protein TrCOL_g2524 [Triparma columacea]